MRKQDHTSGADDGRSDDKQSSLERLADFTRKIVNVPKHEIEKLDVKKKRKTKRKNN